MKLTAKKIKELIKIRIKSYEEVAEYHKANKSTNTAKKLNDRAITLKDLLCYINSFE